MMRSTPMLAALLLASLAPLEGQGPPPAPRTWHQPVVHHGKWLTAGATVAFVVLAQREHGSSQRDWERLLTICRSADDACTQGPDGRYLRADAEQFYQRSRVFDRRANRRILGAQISLLATAALFIMDLRRQDGPENIPFSPLRVSLSPMADGAAVEMRVAF